MRELVLRGSNVVVKVDDDDYDRVAEHKWYIHTKGYAQAFIDGRMTLMHRFIMSPPKSLQIDHIDRDKTNNQRFNLRVVTKAVNAQNIPPKANNTSGYVGVSRNGVYWQSSIYKDGKRQFIGNFKDKESAAVAYNERALLLYGDKAFLNQVPVFSAGDRLS